MPLDIEEYVSLAGVDSLEVGLFYTAVIEVEPGFVVGGKGSVVTCSRLFRWTPKRIENGDGSWYDLESYLSN